MPSREQIKSQLAKMPILSEYQAPRLYPEMVWAGNENGGHFHFYRKKKIIFDAESLRYKATTGPTLSISGSERSKEAIAADFINVLGAPDSWKEVQKATRRKIAFLTWLQLNEAE